VTHEPYRPTVPDFATPKEERIWPPPAYKAKIIRNKQGKAVMRMEFEGVEELELFFMDELIGSDMMKGSASKVIGTTLLIWDKKTKPRKDTP